MPRRLRTAILIAFVCHGLFILTARYRLSYDAYTHMLFANHYAEEWFSLWETRWYTGFTVVSYPPLTHQLIALFVPLLGFDKAFALILWIVTSLYPLGIYAFSRVYTGKTAAAYAALAAAILLPLYVTAHIFGQLPFLTSTLTALFGATCINRYLREGGLHDLALSVGLITTCMAMHHATLMVQPLLLLAVVVNTVFQQPKPNRAFWLVLVQRLLGFVATAAIMSLIVIFPFWQWGLSQTMQTPIDHLSRHNFFRDPLASLVFFFPLYGPFIALIPFLFRKWPTRLIGLLISFTTLFLLGLGGTTPLPRLFFGKAWEWLTYDRFALWAALMLSPFFGLLFIGFKRRWRHRFVAQPVQVAPRRKLLTASVFSFFAITALGSWFTPLVVPFQPEPIELQPIVDFLDKGDNSQWRYITLGFGDQFAFLNLLTTATTIDGSYHTARTLPEMRTSGVGQVDTSYWALNGLTLIKPVLQKSGAHSVRWGFVNPKTVEAIGGDEELIYRSPFLSVLEEIGWRKIETLNNGIWVYENPNAVPISQTLVPTFPPFTSFAWGVFPMLSLVSASALGALRVYPVQAEWILRKIYSLVIALLPLGLCFWSYRSMGDFSHSRVYFTYDNALFFVSDALVVLAITLWLAVKITRGAHGNEPKVLAHTTAICLLVAILVFITFSIFWSRDWRTSFYIAIHFWMVFLLILSLQDWHEAWLPAMYGLCAALLIQLAVGFFEFASQSTWFLSANGLEWPGTLDPSTPGASVVQLANGFRILRVYGTLPHPNILGGLVLISLLGPISILLSNKARKFASLLLISLGLILLTLTFSRAAWLGCVTVFAILVLKARNFERSKVALLISAMIVTMLFAIFPLRELIFTRISNQSIATEQISAGGRSWLTQQALQVIQRSPAIGVGIGSFILALADTAEPGAPIEPVHSLFLLITAELGTVGMLLLTCLCISVAFIVIKVRSPNAVLVGAIIAGLGVISLFDHYLWTLAPGRVMLGLALGLWVGQVAHDA